MKKNLLFLVSTMALLCNSVVFSQCPPGDVSISSQADVDNFGTTYPACTTISGALAIQGADITNLNGFSNISTVNSYIDLTATPLLTSLSGFNNLTTIGGLYVYSQIALADVSALNNITTVTSVGSPEGVIQFDDNAALTNITLNGLTSTADFFSVTNCPNLTTISAPILGSVNSSFSLAGNPLLNDVDFTALTTVTQYFYIEDTALTDLSGFTALTSVTGYLNISNNPVLTDATGLQNLTTLNGFLQVENNDLMTSLTGLNNLNPALLTNVNIYDNPLLAVCNVSSICTYLSGGISTIHTNAIGCNTALEVSTACGSLCPVDVTIASQADADDFGVTYAHCDDISGNFLIFGTDITNLNGLSHLETVGGYLDFSGTPLLADFSGLDHLQYIGGTFYYYSQDTPTVNAFPALTSIGDSFVLYGCGALTSFTMPNLQTIGGFVQVEFNTNLTTLAVPELTTVPGTLVVNVNPALSAIDFGSVTSAGPFYFEGNAAITSMGGFDSLTTINGYLDITNNPALTSVTNLSALTAVNGAIQFENNDSLTSLTGLENINPASLTSVNIYLNDNLSVCNIPGSICTYLEGANPSTIIHDNATGCNSAAQITALCNLTCATTTTWDGVAWDNGAPNSTTAAVFSGDYSSSGDLSACTVTIYSAGVTINSGDDFFVAGAISVDSAGSFIFENNANLIQDLNTTNTGKITSKREASMRRLDYTYWGSPVAGQNLKVFSPQTVSPPVGNSRFYTLNEATNSFQVIADPTAEAFLRAKGYVIRAPNNFGTSPQTFPGEFTGVANNGDTTIAITNSGQGFNLLGNPYPSPVDADLFLAENPGELYFWTHFDQGADSGENYATYTTFGAAASAGGAVPNGIIQTGQGFLLKTASAGNAIFTNEMRVDDHAGQFFRNSNIVEKHRIWLNLRNETNLQNQILVGYMTGATMDADGSVDAQQIESGISNIASLIGSEKYNIQARALPFNESDEIPLSFNALNAGTFTIGIDHLDGLFEGDQNIFLKDNVAGITHNLKLNPYTFGAESGTSTNRFSVVFQNSTLGVSQPVFEAANVVLYKTDDVLNINSGSIIMANVKVFDVRGRLVYEIKDTNSQLVALNGLNAKHQVILIQITSDKNEVVTKKAVY